MPRKADPDKKIRTSKDTEVYQSKYEANSAWEKTIDKLIIRLPRGSKDIIHSHLQKMQQEYPDNEKYSSVNLMIRNLLEQEVGQKFD